VTRPQLTALEGAQVFSVTRSLDEAQTTLRRRDQTLTWGLGVHPGVAAARSSYSPDRFRELLPHFALVGEVGLDRRAGGRDGQGEIFSDVLTACQDEPVLVSIHSAGRTDDVVRLIEKHRPRGPILHWFLGTPEEVDRAVSAGAYFSVNTAMTPAVFETTSDRTSAV